MKPSGQATAGARAGSRVSLLAVWLLPLAGIAGSCATPVDLKQSLELTDVTSGWYDAGVVAGKNKIIPSATFRLRKKAPVNVDRVAINSLFRAVDGKESDLDNDVFVQRVDFNGDRTSPITIRPDNGYTADPPQSRADMLKHSQFRDMRVQILVKHGSSQWQDIGWIDIKRQLLTH